MVSVIIYRIDTFHSRIYFLIVSYIERYIVINFIMTFFISPFLRVFVTFDKSVEIVNREFNRSIFFNQTLGKLAINRDFSIIR